MAVKAKPKNNRVTDYLGPVENLESYVKADWWRNLFNANYLRTDGDVVDDPEITRSEVDIFLDILMLSKENTILDLCCGQGRHTIELSRRGFTSVYGIDRSHYLITRARTLAKNGNYPVTFKEGDARKLPFATNTFNNVIIAGNSFGYFESADDDQKVLQEIARVMKPKGVLLIDVTDGSHVRNNFEARSWEWIDKNYFVCRERSLSDDNNRLITREVITHAKKGVIADQFYAERLYSRDDLSDLFRNVEFENMRFHREVVPASRRNQDLGMMAKRIILTCSPKKVFAPFQEIKKKVKRVAVLMGDPHISDIVKPAHSFDEDDFFTINALKKALSELKKFQFVYFNAHDALIHNLQEIRGQVDFVFNLCDEGFNNEASKELHVPAFLEMLNIPYTGAAPQCLAHCYDKSLVRGIAGEMDIPTPKAFLINPEDISFFDLPLEFPVIVKPNFGDSSFGITQDNVCADVHSLEHAINLVREKFGYTAPILVEALLTGKDISVGIIGNPPESYMTLPIIEEDYSRLPEDLPKICGYEAKWMPDSPYWSITSIPAVLPEDVQQFLVASCLRLFTRLGCRDYARFDWRLDGNGTPRLLEVNPNPGWCWDGHLAKMAKITGLSYSHMLNEILKACMNRLEMEAIQKDKRPLIVKELV